MKSQAVGTVLLGLRLGVVCGQPSAMSAQPPKESNQGPVQAELLKHLNVRHLTSGQTLFARVTLDWSGPDCVLRQGSILEATVEVSDPHRLRDESRLALSFTRAQCNGADMQPLNLVLAAVAEAPQDWKIVPDAQFRMPLSFGNPHGNGLPGFGSAGLGDLYATHLDLTGIVHRFPMRPNLEPGDILGIKDLKLEIGTGPNRSSVIASKRRDVSLGAFTQLLLVPASLAFRPSPIRLASTGSAERLGAPRTPLVAAAAIPADTLNVCAPPGCAVDLPVTAKELEGHKASSIAIRPLGYAPRSGKVLVDFDDEENLAWLGPRELLFAFNPHRLIRRAGASNHGKATRIIRAVLLDSAGRNIVRAVDWEITDSRRYLWPLDEDRVLVHVGNELRVYRAGLEVEHSIPLAGPLAFVRIAPNGELMAVATLRERHSRELHAKLREELGGEPEEDIDVAVLDKGFKTVAQTTTISGLLPPTLLNEGQVKLLAQPKMRYRIAMNTWENSATTLARFESRCTPELSSMAPDLLFLLTCNAINGDTEYRVLRADGKLLLRGEAGPREVNHEAMGNDRSRTFAVKVVDAQREIASGAEFKGSDLDAEEVRIYRADDGKRLLALRVNDPVASHGGYAISGDGSQLAVLSGSQIEFFPIPAK